ncbi:MAG: paraquat-inducible protein B [Gammaproteobacteria bacterium]|nr:MAG: paraquat-inducible protein B [Gammaproteobacteria bacterium]
MNSKESDSNKSNIIESSVEANVQPMKSISSIWFVPVIAVFIGLWMVYYQWSIEGPEITIEFSTAEGLVAGKTKIKSRNVDIGEVSSIVLNEKSDGVLVTARMTKSAEKLIVEDSKFWVVSPQITLTGISGLSTLVSGEYIAIAPGKSSKEETSFIGLNDPPVTPADTPGLHITLNSKDQFAYSKGDPIIYKGLTVGQFEDIHFNFYERVVYYNAFIKAPYHELVTSNTKFWDISGLRIDLNADGLSVNTGNVQSMITNGVTFGIPTGLDIGESITERAYFDIYPNYETADDERYKESVKFILLISDTIRGLKVGAPVEYRGVLIGKVLSTNMLPNTAPDEMLKNEIKIPVLIGLQPGRVGLPDNQEGVERMTQQNRYWVKGGLKAMLRSGNLLTGSLFVDLQHFNDQPVEEIETFANFPVMPTITNEFSKITEKAGEFVDSLNKLPLDNLSKNANQLFNEFTQTAKELQSISKSLDKLLVSANNEKLGEQLSKALQGISTLTNDFSSGSKGHKDIRKTLKALTDTMQELSPLLNQLNRQPNGLIFNSGQTDIIEPKKHTGEKN